MMKGKRKYIEDCARLIEERVVLLELELEIMKNDQSDVSNAADRGAILEAKHIARLIRHLGDSPYTGSSYQAAVARMWGKKK